MSFDVAKCMERTPEETKADINSINRCLNPLSLYNTADLVRELARREEVAIHEIKEGDVCEIAHERTPTGLGPHFIFKAIPRYEGPVKILVVRGERE